MIYHITVNKGPDTKVVEAHSPKEFQEAMRELYNEHWNLATVYKFHPTKGYESARFIKRKGTNWIKLN
jgi:hypothetical protein